MAGNGCQEHSGIKEILNTHEKRLDNHDARLDAGETRMDDIEKEAVEQRADMKGLCKRLDRLIPSIWAAIGVASAFIPLIIWVLERR